ncbi:maleylpyruvate isomerase family mycothiol-dependent enzyme [Kitasatospora paranensis]|uniref:Maleylpyruvate isomerase family mycothiol-dependent enzyme n=1 Tax=Kitasatospora paranensis TaxID=258053 RepID=A0ABW2FWD3_9ACTN
MATTRDPWPLVHAERRALLADAGRFTAEQWATASLCPGRTVRDTLAHMTATARTTPPGFFLKMAGAGFRFEVMASRDIAALTAGTPADTLAAFAARADSVAHPPGPVDSWLGETVVHAEDIRRPLGLVRAYPPEALTRCADFYRRSNLLIGGKRRVAGLTLRATDAAWTAGSGPEVAGPMLGPAPGGHRASCGPRGAHGGGPADADCTSLIRRRPAPRGRWPPGPPPCANGPMWTKPLSQLGPDHLMLTQRRPRACPDAPQQSSRWHWPPFSPPPRPRRPTTPRPPA